MPTLEALNQSNSRCLVDHIGIEFIAIDDDSLTARMPVDERTRQPYGILHCGASVVLAETIGSMGSAMCVDLARYRVVGLDINANHIRAVSSGFVTATASALHIGRRTHVWSIRQVDENDRLTCVSRLTMAIIDGQA
ncbi:MAG: hotdog fold thioesterase [Pseudomonadota bacterium]